MGVIKHFDYSPQVVSISLVARALAHPCRVNMIELLLEKKELNNLAFVNHFGMSRSTIHDHLIKLWQADIINIKSAQDGTIVSMSKSQIEKMNLLKSLFNFETKDSFHLGVLL